MKKYLIQCREIILYISLDFDPEIGDKFTAGAFVFTVIESTLNSEALFCLRDDYESTWYAWAYTGINNCIPVARLKPDNGAHGYSEGSELAEESKLLASFTEGPEVSDSIFETNRKAYLRHWRITQFIKNDRRAQHWCKGSPCACMGCVNKGLSAEWRTLYPEESKITEDEFSEAMRTINDAHLTEQLDAANARIKELEQWKKEAMEVMGPIIDYCHDHKNTKRLGLSLGDSITDRVLEILKNFNAIRI